MTCALRSWTKTWGGGDRAAGHRQAERQAHPSLASTPLSRSLQHKRVAQQQPSWGQGTSSGLRREVGCVRAEKWRDISPRSHEPGHPLGESWNLRGASPKERGVREPREGRKQQFEPRRYSLSLDIPQVPPKPGLTRGTPHAKQVPSNLRASAQWGPQSPPCKTSSNRGNWMPPSLTKLRTPCPSLKT